MIPEIYVEQWRNSYGWQTLAQIEQDLIICRALVDLYNNDHVKTSLVFRGGTALNKLFLKPPSRYSEDIDFVQKNADPIGQTIDTIRTVLKPWLGDPKWKVTRRSAKLIYKYEAINKLPSKLKLEINTTEHFQVLPLRTEKFDVKSDWFSGTANIATYEIDELIATKLRALYQRRKGRDLFDLWYVTSQNIINLDRVIDIFAKYCKNDNVAITRDEFIKNLELKKDNQDFQLDMDFLLPQYRDWDYKKAYQFVIENVLEKLP
ncbi:MAG TPA: nucleotidyl transferase AbiEii/AbiGii toxin family protein [Gammaproteobacteria bacterium]|nr:nucleotidyl transferase AbiEii/AbiGii toxin family protein [Gammaproteobacteria bacterium]